MESYPKITSENHFRTTNNVILQCYDTNTIKKQSSSKREGLDGEAFKKHKDTKHVCPPV